MAPGETEEAIRAEMDRIIAGKSARWRIDTVERRTWTGPEVRYAPFHEAWRIDGCHPLARAFDAAYRDTFGRAPGDYVFWDFSTNAVATVREGIPTIGFGPGDYRLAHMRGGRCLTMGHSGRIM